MSLLRTGQKSGKISAMFMVIADRHEENVRAGMKQLTTILEQLAIGLVALVIGAVVIGLVGRDDQHLRDHRVMPFFHPPLIAALLAIGLATMMTRHELRAGLAGTLVVHVVIAAITAATILLAGGAWGAGLYVGAFATLCVAVARIDARELIIPDALVLGLSAPSRSRRPSDQRQPNRPSEPSSWVPFSLASGSGISRRAARKDWG